jgi:CspA family cold shock protein
MPTGTIKTKTDKGFGFIKMDDGSKDVFFHSSECNQQWDNLAKDQQVSFELEMGEKGPKAKNVVAI